MKNTINRELVDKSYEFIHQNPDVQNTKVPCELLREWAVREFAENSKAEPTYTQLMIFMIVYQMNYPQTDEQETIMHTYHFVRAFQRFQIVLAATQFLPERVTDDYTIHIFHLDEYCGLQKTFSSVSNLLEVYFGLRHS